jgi:hypothetical protein
MRKYLFSVIFFAYITSVYSQNIGISNDAAFTTPQSPLHIYWTSDGNLLQLSRSSAANTGLTFSVSSGDFSILNRNNNALIFGTNAAERMRITNTGNVGIGTTAPATQLHTTGTVRFQNYVSGANGAILRTNSSGDLSITNFSGTANDVLLGTGSFGSMNTLAWQLTGNSGTNPASNFIGTTDAQDLVIRTQNSERMRIMSSGAVRIGYGTAATDALQIGGYGTTNPTVYIGAEGSAPGYGRIGLYGTTYGTFSTIIRGGGLSYFNSGNQYVFGDITPKFATDFMDVIGNATYPDAFSAYTTVANATAIYGESSAAGGTGVWGSATNDANSWGVWGSSSTGYGLIGLVNGTTGTGVYGINSAVAGTNIGFAGFFRSEQRGGAALAIALASTNTYLSNSAISAYCANYNAATNALYAYNDYSTASVNPAWAIRAYMTNSTSNDGNGYAQSSNNSGGIRSYNFNGAQYSFGIAGWNWNDDNRCGGVLGGRYNANYWGALGYKASNNTGYGVYGSNAYSSGGGKSSEVVYSGVGIGGYGSLFGATFRGQIYGMVVKGERYATYTDGKQFTNNYIAQLHNTENSTSRVATFVTTSTSVDIIDRGVGSIVNGNATINFKKEFRELISDNSPIVITVTPIGRTANLYIANQTKSGFVIVDGSDNSDKSTPLNFAWIAIGVNKGFENPQIPEELLSPQYDTHLDEFLFNDNDTTKDGKPIWWDGSQLRFDAIPIEHSVKKEEKEKVNVLEDNTAKMQPKRIKDKSNTIIKDEKKKINEN